MVAAALDVERGQVQAARARRAEEEAPHVLDHGGVEPLALLERSAAEEGLDPALAANAVGLEEGVTERDQRTCGDRRQGAVQTQDLR